MFYFALNTPSEFQHHFFSFLHIHITFIIDFMEQIVG